jgi:signal transduction histidine kinase
VEVRLARVEEHLRLRIDDDGQGMTQASSSAGGAGLASMRLRASRLGGQLRIDSDATGTALHLEFPLVS